MNAPEDFRGRSSRVQFLGSESEALHGRWYGLIAERFDAILGPDRPELASEFLHDVFRRHEPVQSVLDVACGPFSIDEELQGRGYDIRGCDVSVDMLEAARERLRQTGGEADLHHMDMRELDLSRRFDAVVCLGTAFNYLYSTDDWRSALQRFRDHLSAQGLLVLDLTNFEAWIDDPENIRVEAEYRTPDGTQIAIFAFNEQNADKSQHLARFLTVLQRNDNVDIAFDEAILKVWRKDALAGALQDHGFRPIEWWGDLKKGEHYESSESPRLICIARRA